MLNLLTPLLYSLIWEKKMYWPETLRAESRAEVYIYIDKYYKKLPKSEGQITGVGIEFLDNDVDALRHSYVSGVLRKNMVKFLPMF